MALIKRIVLIFIFAIWWVSLLVVYLVNPVEAQTSTPQPTNTYIPTRTPTNAPACPGSTPLPTQLSSSYLAKCSHCITPGPTATYALPKIILPTRSLTNTPIGYKTPTPSPTLTGTPNSVNNMLEIWSANLNLIDGSIGGGYANVVNTHKVRVGYWNEGWRNPYGNYSAQINFDINTMVGVNNFEFEMLRIEEQLSGYQYPDNCVMDFYSFDGLEFQVISNGQPYGGMFQVSNYPSQDKLVGIAIIENWNATAIKIHTRSMCNNTTGGLYDFEITKINGISLNPVTPTPNPGSCGSYQYANHNPVAGVGGTWSITDGECVTIIPAFGAISIPAISIDILGITSPAVNWAGLSAVGICPKIVTLPTLNFVGFTIPIAIFTLPLVAFLVDKVFKL